MHSHSSLPSLAPEQGQTRCPFWAKCSDIGWCRHCQEPCPMSAFAVHSHRYSFQFKQHLFSTNCVLRTVLVWWTEHTASQEKPMVYHFPACPLKRPDSESSLCPRKMFMTTSSLGNLRLSLIQALSSLVFIFCPTNFCDFFLKTAQLEVGPQNLLLTPSMYILTHVGLVVFTVILKTT